MTNKLETSLTIKAGVTGTEQLSKLANEIEQVGGNAEGLKEQGAALARTFGELKNQQGLIDNFVALKQNSENLHNAWQQTQEKSKTLAQSLSSAKQKLAELKEKMASDDSEKLANAYQKQAESVKKLENNFKKVINEAGKQKTAYQDNEIALAKLRQEMHQVGISTTNLAQAKQKLASQSKQAQEQLDHLTNTAKKMHEIAKAKTTLGLGVDVSTKQKIDELTKSFELLKEKGGLSKKELALAAENYKTKLAQLQGEMDETTQSANKMGGVMGGLKTTMGGLKGMLAGLGVTVGAKELLDMAEGFKSLEARVKLATGEGVNFVNAMDGLKTIANETNTGLNDTATLFTKIDGAGKALGLTQKESLEVTKSINQAIKLSGGSAESSAAAIQQLVQGLQSGALRGDEFNSVLEQAPELAKTMADGLGVTIGQLRAMAGEGKLTAETVIGAMQSQADAIESRYKQLPTTVGDAVIGLQNELLLFVGTLDKELGGSNAVVNFLMGIKNGINDIDPATLEAIKLAFENLGEIAQTLWQSVGDVANAFTAFNNMGNEESISLITSLMQKLALATGAVSDGIKAIAMVANGAFGAIVREVGRVYEAFAMMTGQSRLSAQEMQKTGQAMIDSAKAQADGFESSFGKAWDNMGKTAKQRLDETTQTARQKYDEMAQSGTASAGKLEEAFIDYAQKAIKANDGIVDETLKRELAEKNLQAVVGDTGKITIESLSQASTGLNKASNETDELKQKLDSLSKHNTAFKALGIDIEEFATGINSKANTALSAFSELSGVVGQDVAKLAQIYNATKDKIGENTYAQKALNAKLLESVGGNQNLASAVQAYAKEQQNAKSATDAQNKALSDLGINMSAINQGMSDGGQKIAQSLAVGLSAIKETAQGADALKTALSQAFDVSVQKAQTTADFGAIKTAIEQAGVSAQLSAEQQKILNAGLTGGADAVKALKVATDESAKATTADAQAKDGATKATSDNTTAVNQNTEAQKANAAAAKATEDSYRGLNLETGKTGKIIELQSQSFNEGVSALMALGASAEEAKKAFLAMTKFKDGIDTTAAAYADYSRREAYAAEQIKAQVKNFENLKQEVSQVSSSLSGAELSTHSLAEAQAVLNRATAASVGGIIELDKSTLNNLRNQIEQARQEMQNLADDAKNTADSMEGELARMRGNDRKALEIENAQKLEAIEKRLEEARRRGNAAEIAQLQRQLDLQKQINSEKLRQASEKSTNASRSSGGMAVGGASLPSTTRQGGGFGMLGNGLSAGQVAGAFDDLIRQSEQRGAENFAKELMSEAKRLANG